jgi:hypothetical protein
MLEDLTLFSLAVSIRVKAIAVEFPPRCDPVNIQFLRPMATGFMARSAVENDFLSQGLKR